MSFVAGWRCTSGDASRQVEVLCRGIAIRRASSARPRNHFGRHRPRKAGATDFTSSPSVGLRRRHDPMLALITYAATALALRPTLASAGDTQHVKKRSTSGCPVESGRCVGSSQPPVGSVWPGTAGVSAAGSLRFPGLRRPGSVAGDLQQGISAVWSRQRRADSWPL